MYRGFKVVAVTPAGRRRYMKVLAPYVLSSDLVDEYQIWVNTKDQEDIAFFEALAATNPKVKLYRLEGKEPNGVHTIGAFFVNCIDPGAVYIRFDDDVVYLHDGFFEKLVDFRLDNPRYFLVSPVVFNNALCTYVLMCCTKDLVLKKYMEPYAFSDLGWKSGTFAAELHRYFFQRYRKGTLDRIKFGTKEISLARFSINCISWTGEEFAKFGGVLPAVPDEEEFLSVTKPLWLGKSLALTSTAIACHFAFGPQREFLDQTDVLETYARICQERHGELYDRIANLTD